MGKSNGKKAPVIDIGISEKDRAAIARGLSKLLADTYTLYLTTPFALTQGPRPIRSRAFTAGASGVACVLR